MSSSDEKTIQAAIAISKVFDPKNPLTNFLEQLLYNQEFDIDMADSMVNDIRGGKIAKVNTFLNKIKNQNLLGKLIIDSGDPNFKSKVIDYLVHKNHNNLPPIDNIDSMVPTTLTQRAKSNIDILYDKDGYIYDEGKTVQTGPNEHNDTQLVLGEFRLNNKTRMIKNYSPGSDPDNTIVINYLSKDHHGYWSEEDNIEYNYPYSATEVAPTGKEGNVRELVKIKYYTDPNDEEKKVRYDYTYDDTVLVNNSVSNIVLHGSFAMTILSNKTYKPSEHPDSNEYKLYRQISRTMGISYPKIAKQIINAIDNQGPPPDPGTPEYDKMKIHYRKTESLRAQYATFDDYYNDQKQTYEDAKEANDGNNPNDDLRDIFITFNQPLNKNGYLARLAIFDSLRIILPQTPYCKNNYISHNDNESFYGVINDIVTKNGKKSTKIMLSTEHYEINKIVVSKDYKWYNFPYHMFKKERHLHANKKTFYKIMLKEEDKEFPSGSEIIERTKMSGSCSGSYYTGNMCGSSQNKIKMIVMRKQVPLPNGYDASNYEAYEEIILNDTYSNTLITSKDGSAWSEGTQAKGEDSLADKNKTQNQFIYPILYESLKHQPFYYKQLFFQEMLCLEYTYIHVTIVPWYQTALFRFLIGLILVIIITVITGGGASAVAEAIMEYIIGYAVSYAIGIIAKELNMPFLTIIMQVGFAIFMAGGLAAMTAPQLMSLTLDAVGKIIMIHIDEQFKSLDADIKNFEEKAAERKKKIEDLKYELGDTGEVGIGSFIAWLKTQSPYEKPKDFYKRTKRPPLAILAPEPNTL